MSYRVFKVIGGPNPAKIGEKFDERIAYPKAIDEMLSKGYIEPSQWEPGDGRLWYEAINGLASEIEEDWSSESKPVDNPFDTETPLP